MHRIHHAIRSKKKRETGGCHVDESLIIENMVAWACARLGDTSWYCRGRSFVEDALGRACDNAAFGGDATGRYSELSGAGLRQGMPERGALVLYDCPREGDDKPTAGPLSWDHCGISLDQGSVVHAWDEVRIDDYRAIERLRSTTGAHPTYLGWVSVSHALRQRGPRPGSADETQNDATPSPHDTPVLREIAPDEVARLRPCLEALEDHHNRVSVHFRGCYPKAPFDETIARFRRELAQGSAHIAVMEAGGTVVGFGKVDIEGGPGGLGSLDYLVVLPEHRGQGLGDALMGWALARFHAAGVADIDVKVADGNDALSFYERYGFRPNAHILRLSHERKGLGA